MKPKNTDEKNKKTRKKDIESFFVCGYCGRFYKNPQNLPVRCIECGQCLLCDN